VIERLALHELHDRPAEIAVAEGARRGDAQVAARLLVGVVDHRFEVVDPLQDLHRLAQIHRSGLGQRQLPGRAVQQADAELVLELADIFREQRLRAAEPPRRGREPAGLGDPHEGLHARQRVHDDR